MKAIFLMLASTVLLSTPIDDNYLAQVIVERESNSVRVSLHGAYAFTRLLVEHNTDHEFCSRYFFCELGKKIAVEVPDAWKQNLSLRFAKGKFAPRIRPTDKQTVRDDRGTATFSGDYELPKTSPAIRAPIFECETNDRLFAVGVLKTGFSNLLIYDCNSKRLLQQIPITATETETYNLPPEDIDNAADLDMRFDSDSGTLYVFWISHNDMGIDAVDVAKLRTRVLFLTSDTLSVESKRTPVQKNSN